MVWLPLSEKLGATDRGASQGWLFAAARASKRVSLSQPLPVPVPLTLFDLISPAAFSSLWYWIVTALVWARLAHAPLGVPVDLYARAAEGGRGDADLFVLVRVGVQRHLGVADRMGPMLVGGWAFVLSTLGGLAIWYGLELAQAILLILAPMALAQMSITRAARRLSRMAPETDLVMRELRKLRVTVQVIGLGAIFCAALFGMIHNLHNAIL